CRFAKAKRAIRRSSRWRSWKCGSVSILFSALTRVKGRIGHEEDRIHRTGQYGAADGGELDQGGLRGVRAQSEQGGRGEAGAACGGDGYGHHLPADAR